MTIMMLLFTRKLNKEKYLFYSNIYCNIKVFVNLIFACFFITFLIKRIYISILMSVLIGGISFIALSIFDSYLIFRRNKKIRNLSVSNKEYVFDCTKTYLIMYMSLFIFMQFKYAMKNTEDLVFILVCMLSIWIYQYLTPYIIMATNRTQKFKHEKIIAELQNVCDYRYKIYLYEGQKSKNANAITTGTFLNRYIFISDYFVDNATEDEVLSLLCHECGHVKNYDIEKRLAFISISVMLFYTATCIMDYLKTSILAGLIFLMVSAIIAIILFKKIQQTQEFRADKYAVYVIGNKDIFVSVLEKLYDLNDMQKKTGALWALLSTHPKLEDRINIIYHMDLKRSE